MNPLDALYVYLPTAEAKALIHDLLRDRAERLFWQERTEEGDRTTAILRWFAAVPTRPEMS